MVARCFRGIKMLCYKMEDDLLMKSAEHSIMSTTQTRISTLLYLFSRYTAIMTIRQGKATWQL